MSGRLEGKVALVSGAARGQGAAEVRLFAAEGARVVLGDVLVAEGEVVARDIVAAGGVATFVELDVSSEAAWEGAVELAVSEYGGLDVLVNNAGIYRDPGVAETTLDVWNEVLAVNLTGTFLGMRAAIPALRRSKAASIVNISSVVALVGIPKGAAYVATKGGVLALSRAAAVELAPDGIRVNSVHPGAIDTPMADDATGGDEEARRQVIAMHPIGRWGTPEEVASAVLFLASDESSFMTGSALVVDGGNSAW